MHIYLGGALRLVVNKEQARMFISDLQSWAGRANPIPEESQEPNRLPETPITKPDTDSAEPVAIVENRPDVIAEIASALEMVFELLIQRKPTMAELSKALMNSVTPDLYDAFTQQASAMVPDKMKPIFNLLRTL
jgi:hypothetical protein